MSSYEENNPLTPIHSIGHLTYTLAEYAHAMQVLGLPVGEDLFALSEEIRALSKEAADRVCRETSLRLQEQQASTNQILGAALTACLIKGEANARTT